MQWFADVMCLMAVLIAEALKRFNDVNGSLPGWIIVYRDGVGDGQVRDVIVMTPHSLPLSSLSLMSCVNMKCLR